MMPDRRFLLWRFLGCVALILVLGLGAGPGYADAVQALRAALARADMGDWAGARAAADGAVAADLVEWRRLRSGAGTLPEVEAFLGRRADWPGLALIRQNGEARLSQAASAEQVMAYFAERAPVTAAGSIALARALAQMGRQADAEAEAVRAWVTFAFNAGDEALILAQFPEALGVAHEVRLDRLLWQGRVAEARRMMARVPSGWQALAAARLGLRDDAPGVNALIAAVPPDLVSDPGLVWERFAWRMRRERYAEAGALIVAQSTSVAALGDPEVWADRRALLARRLLRDGDAATAYRAAANHFLTRGADFADLEFVAGFAALRHLGDPALALGHFERLQAAVTTPISLARAHYWQARAHEALGNASAAETAFRAAAEHPGAYYGLLAAERLGLPLDPAVLVQAPVPDWRQAEFAGSSVLEAARLLAAAGDRAGAKRFFLHLAEDLNRTELAQLSDLALAMEEPHIALLIAKQAAERGVILPRAYHPLSAMVPDGLAVSRAWRWRSHGAKASSTPPWSARPVPRG